MFIRCEICFAILFIAVGSVSAVDCPENMGCSCHLNKEEHSYNILCNVDDSSIRILFEESKSIKITCNNSKWSNFQLHNLTKRAISSVYFYMCDLPNNRSLKTITDMLGATGVKELHFNSYKNLISFERLHLQGFENLSFLDISKNNISIVDTDLLADLSNLTRLDLRKSNLLHIASILSDHVPKLQELDLEENMLQIIEPGTFNRFYNLKQLFLSKNSITGLESGTFDNLVNLRNLHLKSNNLVSLPKDIFGQLKNLEKLDLNENNFTYLPRYLLQNNTNLRLIDLAFNKQKLDTLPSGFFSNLTKLELLLLERNGLNSLPKDLLWGCFSLESLRLSKNNLAFLHNLIFRDLKELTELALDFNAFEKVPDVFRNLKQLKYLDLSKNHISFINKKDFKDLHKLIRLNMAENYLSIIADGSLIVLKNLEIANFSHNNLTLYTTSRYETDEIVVDSPFASCYSLEELYLSNNRISEIFSDWLTDLENLRKLDLKNNYISSLSTEDLLFSSKDIEVDLTYNKIRYISLKNAEDFFDYDWSNKVVILIQHNPLHCDCKLYDYLRYIEGKMLSNIKRYFNINPKNVTCHTPLIWRNVSVTDFPYKLYKCAAINTDASLCPDKCNCYKKLEEQSFIIDCSRKNFTVVPSVKNIPHNFYQIILNLSDNQLTQTSNLTKLGYGSISNLILSHNNISEISLDGLPKTLHTLELHNNKISKLSSEVINFLKSATNLRVITLHGNPFICNCSTIDFFNFTHTFEKYRIADLHMIKCQEKNKSIFKITINDFCSNEVEWFRRNFIWIAFVIFGLFIICFFYWKNKKRFINKFELTGKLLLEDDEDDEESDVTECEENDVIKETSL